MGGYWQDGVRSDNEKDGALANLCFTLQLLAARGVDQLAHFPPSVSVADELALDYDHWSTSIHSYWSLSQDQTACLNSLDDYLDAMGGERNRAVWTDEALLSDPRWERVRHLARLALASFGLQIELPPPAHYVPPSDR
jgi:hypothetical protein